MNSLNYPLYIFRLGYFIKSAGTSKDPSLVQRGGMFVIEKDVVIPTLLTFEVSTEWNVKWGKCCVNCQA